MAYYGSGLPGASCAFVCVIMFYAFAAIFGISGLLWLIWEVAMDKKMDATTIIIIVTFFLMVLILTLSGLFLHRYSNLRSYSQEAVSGSTPPGSVSGFGGHQQLYNRSGPQPSPPSRGIC